MLIGILLGGYTNRTNLKGWAVSSLIEWVLFAILGWQVFGAAIHK